VLSSLYQLSSRAGDKRTRTADIRGRVNPRLSGLPTDATIEANDRQFFDDFFCSIRCHNEIEYLINPGFH
jgi:hypothetical protein